MLITFKREHWGTVSYHGGKRVVWLVLRPAGLWAILSTKLIMPGGCWVRYPEKTQLWSPTFPKSTGMVITGTQRWCCVRVRYYWKLDALMPHGEIYNNDLLLIRTQHDDMRVSDSVCIVSHAEMMREMASGTRKANWAEKGSHRSIEIEMDIYYLHLDMQSVYTDIGTCLWIDMLDSYHFFFFHSLSS